MTQPRVLLTGASGFIGRQTIAPLLDRGCEVHAVGSTVTDNRARWYRADLLDQAARRHLIAAVRPDALLHAAWVTQHGTYWTSPLNLDWVSASLDLVRAAAEQGTRRILIVGSCAEYDWRTPPARPWREDDPRHPATLYGTAKDTLHRLTAAFAAQTGIALVWARLFHLYGPHEAPSRLVPTLLAALRAGTRAQTGPADAMRDVMHVADAGRALAHLLASDATGAFNVASGRPMTIGDLAARVARIGGRPDLQAVATRPGTEPQAILADVTRLKATGFTTAISVDDGLANLWGEQAPAAPPDYDQAARLFRANRRDEARTAVEAVLAHQPDHAPALNLLGVLHRQRGAFVAARSCLERAAALDPTGEMAWINLGNVHLDMEAADAAVDAYTRGLEAKPERTDTRRLLANALARAGRDAEAMTRFEQALNALPGDTATLRDRAPRPLHRRAHRPGAGRSRLRPAHAPGRCRTAAGQDAGPAPLRPFPPSRRPAARTARPGPRQCRCPPRPRRRPAVRGKARSRQRPLCQGPRAPPRRQHDRGQAVLEPAQQPLRQRGRPHCRGRRPRPPHGRPRRAAPVQRPRRPKRAAARRRPGNAGRVRRPIPGPPRAAGLLGPPQRRRCPPCPAWPRADPAGPADPGGLPPPVG